MKCHRNKRRRWGLIGLVLPGALALLAADGWTVPAGQPACANTPGEQTAASGFGHVDVLDGVLRLAPTIAGRVEEVAVAEGSQVKKGDVLLRLESRLAGLRVKEAAAALDDANRQVELAGKAVLRWRLKLRQQEALVRMAGCRLATAELVRDHAKDRLSGDVINASEYNVAREHVEELKAALEAERLRLQELQTADPALDVRRAEAGVVAARARLEQAQEARDQYVVRAPADGTVLRLLVDAGDLCPGLPSQPAVWFWRADRPLIVRAEFVQESAQGLHEGDRVRVWDYYCKESYTGTGRVRRIDRWFAPQRAVLDEPGRFRDARTLECVVDELKCTNDVGESGRVLRIGQRMRVAIVREGRAGGAPRR